MPANDLVTALTQTLLHKLPVQTAATHRLSCRCGRRATRAYGSSSSCNVL